MTRNPTLGIRRYPHADLLFEQALPLSDGTRLETQLWPDGASLDHIEQYDAFELPLVNYVASREQGFEATAIPVFTCRRFVQWMIEVPVDSDIEGPDDLAGRRVLSAYWGNTDYVWVRGILAEDYGVDLSGVTWVTTKPERVHGAKMPSGGIEHVAGGTPDELFARGLIDAKIIDDHGQDPDPAMRRLWVDPERAAREWFDRTGYFPILHVVAVTDRALAEHPGLAADLFSHFERAKDVALERFAREPIPAERREITFRAGFPGSTRGGDRSYLGPDPLPYGIDENRRALELMVRYAFEQDALWSLPEVDTLFAPVGRG